MRIQEERFVKARYLAQSFKHRYKDVLLRDRNIVGTAFGQRLANGEMTDEPAVVIYVMHKTPHAFIPPSQLLPRRWYSGRDCVEVDVVQTGPIYPFAFNTRVRPAAHGISIGNANDASAGTFGAVVIDNTDGTECILSNNHVLARSNAAAIGENIIQPGVFDGGASPADDIATLKRFVTLNATGNTVDAAIAEITGGLAGGNVIDQVHNNLIPDANPDHPAVGLLFAGSCNRMLMNPIRDVLNQLNIGFPNGQNSVAAADIGMNVEKVGRTTEYTTSTITEIDVTVTVSGRSFDNQIATAWMAEPGDSGSVVYRGGAGGNEDRCGCGSTSAAVSLLGVDLKAEQSMAEVVRDKFLRQTRLGNWAVNVFYLNEETLLKRFHASRIGEDDRAYARDLFNRYIDDARRLFAEGERSEQRLTEQDLREARRALSRARQYMREDEVEASERLFALAEEHALGRNVREILAIMNDEQLFEQVKQILSNVRSLRISEDPC